MAEKTKSTRVKAEMRRLLKIFDGADANKLAVVKPLIERMAYTTISLADLEVQLTECGWVEEYQNGREQSGLKKSAAADCYISLSKNLTAMTKQLLELVPAAQRHSRLEELMRS